MLKGLYLLGAFILIFAMVYIDKGDALFSFVAALVVLLVIVILTGLVTRMSR